MVRRPCPIDRMNCKSGLLTNRSRRLVARLVEWVWISIRGELPHLHLSMDVSRPHLPDSGAMAVRQLGPSS